MKGKSWAVAGIALVLMSAALFAAWHFRTMIRGNLFAIYDLVSSSEPNDPLSPPVAAKLVAHAGGAINGLIYTNSRDALDQSYARGYRVFEVDFDWTSDSRLVLVHDWTTTSNFFGVAPHVFSYAEFVGSARRDHLRQMTFEDLLQWLGTHRDALLVTDIKEDTPRLLGWIQAKGGDIRPQLIIQIYAISELAAARQLSPRAVWFSANKHFYPAWALSRIKGVDAFVVPVADYDQYRTFILAAKLPVYVHSVPAQSVDDTFRRLPGIYGIYVD